MSFDPNAEPIITSDIDTSELDAAGLVPMEEQWSVDETPQTDEFAVDPDYEATTIAAVREASAPSDNFETNEGEVEIEIQPTESIEVSSINEKLVANHARFQELREELVPLRQEHKGLLDEMRALHQNPPPRSAEDSARLNEIKARTAELFHLRGKVAEQMGSLNDEHDRLLDEKVQEERDAKRQESDRMFERMDQIEAEIKKFNEEFDALNQEFNRLDSERRAITARQPDPKLWTPDEVERYRYINMRSEDIMAQESEIDGKTEVLHNEFMEMTSPW